GRHALVDEALTESGGSVARSPEIGLRHRAAELPFGLGETGREPARVVGRCRLGMTGELRRLLLPDRLQLSAETVALRVRCACPRGHDEPDDDHQHVPTHHGVSHCALAPRQRCTSTFTNTRKQFAYLAVA